MAEIISASLIVLGTLWSCIGVLGVVRLPDAISRLHATGKVSVFGLLLLVLAVAIHVPESRGQAIIIAICILFSAPVVSHAIASAALRNESTTETHED